MAGELTTVNPFTGEALARYPYADEVQAAERIGRLRDAQRRWARLGVEARVAAVRDALGYFEDRADEVARDVTQGMGKPIAQARGEVRTLLERARHLCDAAPEALAPDSLPEKAGFVRRIEHVPVGVVFVLSPWNYPLLTTANGLVAALLAGDTVALKHSDLTPAVGEHFARAFGSLAGLAPLVDHLVLSHETVARLIGAGRVDHVVFTGSVAGGHAVARAAAERFVGTNLELGGKDAAYVAEDADLEHAAAAVVDGAMYNAGQSCCGIERAYVHERLHDVFVARCAEIASAYVLGDPTDPATTMGPLARASAAKMLEAQLADAVAKGARIECGGGIRRIGRGTFCEPTVLSRARNDMDVMREESFAPILPIMRVRDDAEALALMNDSAYGLTAAVFTADAARAEAMASDLEVGTVFMNRCDYLDPALPWTGVKDSGRGSSLSRYGFHALTRRKAIHFRCAIS